VSLQNWTSNPLKSRHAPIIAFAGDNVPILAAAAVSPGQYAVPSLTNFGSAVAVMSAYGSPPAAAMFWSAGTAGVNYGQLLQGRP
jgi:hypothetical protein